MAERVCAKDWSATPLGPLATWSDTLLSFVNFALASAYPAVVLWGQDLLMIYNDAYRSFLGTRHPEALGRAARDVWTELWAALQPQFEAVMLEGKAIYKEREWLAIELNGTMQEFYFNYSFTPLCEHGTVTGILNIAHNVTDEVLASHEVHSLTARLNQVLEDTNDAIVMVDPDWCIAYMNPRAQQMSMPVADVIGKNLWQCYPALLDTDSPWVENLHRAMDERIGCAFEAHYGEPIHVWVKVQVQPSKEGITIFSTEVTEQKLAAEQVRASQEVSLRSEEQLRLITDSLPALVAYINPEARYVRVNRAYETWFDLPREKVVGMSVNELLGPEAGAIVRGHLQEALTGVPRNFDITLHTQEKERLVSISHIPDIDEQGKVRGVIIQGHDITARKRAEEALIQTEKLAAAGRLAASIAHEINNPLESITNLVYLARHSDDLGENHYYLDLVERELRRVAGIATQTLRFYKQSGKPTDICGGELFDSIVMVFHGRIINSRVEVERRDRPAPPVLCFEGEIRQVLINLAGNAIDAMQEAGGRLLLRSREATEGRTGQKGIVLTVADTGGGMSPKTRDRIFEAFYSTKGFGGTGLGLWVSKEIVDRHQGQLRVRSSQRVGCSGTVFTLFLPFDAASR